MALTTDSAVWRTLPIELVLDILTFAAAADRATACALSLVCAAAQHRAAPALYHTVKLESARAVTAFAAALASKPPTFAAEHVVHLGILAPGPLPAVRDVLASCTRLLTLACGFSLPAYSARFPAPDAPLPAAAREQHLLGMAARGGRWDDGAICARATHVRVQLGPDAWDALAPARLRQWPCLTHLAVVFTPCTPIATTAAILATTPASATSAIAASAPANTAGATAAPTTAEGANPSDDVRDAFESAVHAADELALAFVLIQVAGSANRRTRAIAALERLAAARGETRVVVEPAPLSPVRQWESAVRAGTSIWDKAEEMAVARKRACACASASAELAIVEAAVASS